MNIIDFINARLDDDERIARAAINTARPGTHWKWEVPDDYSDDPEAPLWLRTVEEFPTTSGVGDLPAFPLGYDYKASPSSRGMEHIARHDPARVLRQAKALRSIVELHGLDEKRKFPDGTTGSCDECSDYGQDYWEMERWPCQTVRDVASIWSDHADYAPEWAS